MLTISGETSGSDAMVSQYDCVKTLARIVTCQKSCTNDEALCNARNMKVQNKENEMSEGTKNYVLMTIVAIFQKSRNIGNVLKVQ